MSALNWTSYSYRNGEPIFGDDFFTGIGYPDFPAEERRLSIKVEKWIPTLFVDGKEVDLQPFVTEGVDTWTNDKDEEVKEFDPDAIEHRYEGEIEGYRFRLHRVMNMVDTEVVDPDGTTWTSRSGMNGFEDYCGAVPWTGDLYDVPWFY